MQVPGMRGSHSCGCFMAMTCVGLPCRMVRPAAQWACPMRGGLVQCEGRSSVLYELRIYECVPGKLPDLNKRFSTITLKLWEKHGIKQAGFWTTVIGESNQTLY